MTLLTLSSHPSELAVGEEIRRIIAGGGWETIASYDKNIQRKDFITNVQKANCVVVIWSKVSKFSSWIREDIQLARKREALLIVLYGENVPEELSHIPNVRLNKPYEIVRPDFSRLLLDTIAAIAQASRDADVISENAKVLNTPLSIQDLIERRELLADLTVQTIGERSIWYARGVTPPSLRAFVNEMSRGPIRSQSRIAELYSEILRNRQQLRFERLVPELDDDGGDGKRVDCSVFSPQIAPPEAPFLVQVFLHTLEQSVAVRELSIEIDDEAKFRGETTLDLQVEAGDRVDILLEGNGLLVQDKIVSILWRGVSVSCNFICHIPSKPKEKTLFPIAWLSIAGRIVGKVTFKISVDASAFVGESTHLENKAKTFHRVFFSYSSSDRKEVSRCAQAYRLAKVEFGLDFLTLKPGDRWAETLIQEIDRCDLFILFWTEAAKKSPWVQLEAMYALLRQSRNAANAPVIVPFVLEGPPVPSPPSYLAHLHFDDWMQWVISTMK